MLYSAPSGLTVGMIQISRVFTIFVTRLPSGVDLP
jgi:hypothetical protein